MPDSPYTDLDRPPLREVALNRALAGEHGPWREIIVVERTTSTNADLAAAARAGEAEGAVLVAELQTAGRGRRERRWSAPPRASLALSVLLRPGVPVARRSWLPLLAGVAVASAVRRVTGIDAELKWPNDVLAEGRKLSGILAEQVGDAIVLGIGVNVSTKEHELPVPEATSVLLAGGANTDRDPLLRALLRELADLYRVWCHHAGDAEACGLAAGYRRLSATLGRAVRVELPDHTALAGHAADIDAAGRLVVGEQAISAGDIEHLR